MHERSILQVDTFAQKQNCTRVQNCTKTILHGGSFLHESKIKNQKNINKRKTEKKVTDWLRVRVRDESDRKNLKKLSTEGKGRGNSDNKIIKIKT